MKIIAESAYNHMGKIAEVLGLMRAAKDSNADYFTIQIMNPKSFSDEKYSKHQLYVDHNISFDEWDLAFLESKKLDLPIIPCALDEESLKYVFGKKPEYIKIHATDLTNPPFLNLISGNKDIKIILETQAATNFEIRFALKIIGNQVDTIITGYSNYPTEYEDINLNSLDFLRSEYKKEIGLADHSPTITEIPLMALAKGCKFLEKHITLTRNNRNFDWQVSLYPEEFKILCAKVQLFQKSLGTGVKHPVKNETPHRSILYKKVLPDGSIKRADNSPDYITHTINNFDKQNVSIAIIARLKSKRLSKKVLRTIGSETLIEALYNNVSQATTPSAIKVATSNLIEDSELVDYCNSKNIPIFKGHPTSVIDRMLDMAWELKSGIILRVTGDNPFTDPSLIDEIIRLVQDNNLDYAKVNNVPFGMSAEALSTSYLWKLYIEMENPMVSEYLTWFVLQDETARKGCIDLEYPFTDLSLKNLSVDYAQDLTDCQKILECTSGNKISESKLTEVLHCCSSLLTDKADSLMKLPGGDKILTSEYISKWKNTNYVIRKTLELKN